MKIEESKKLETRGPADQTKITFRPLYGTYSEDPLSYLLQINDCRILLDCGWNDAHDEALLAPLIEVLGEIDAVLISHPDSCHVGALPYLVSRLKLQVVPSALHLRVCSTALPDNIDSQPCIPTGSSFMFFQ